MAKKFEIYNLADLKEALQSVPTKELRGLEIGPREEDGSIGIGYPPDEDEESNASLWKETKKVFKKYPKLYAVERLLRNISSDGGSGNDGFTFDSEEKPDSQDIAKLEDSENVPISSAQATHCGEPMRIQPSSMEGFEHFKCRKCGIIKRITTYII